MATITTLLSGGECVGVGARAAGLKHLEGFEIDDSIAGVARANGFNVHTADVLELDPTTLQVPDVLHASPVCKNASVANQSAELNEDGTKESQLDIAMGEKVAQFIDVMAPRCFTLENVFAYRKFRAFKIITAALDRNGYMWDFDNLNSADFGVPQTRRRLILRAVRGALLPMLPQPERWVGWYEAIEDLIPGLPDSQFAAWQLARLPEEIKGTFAFSASESNNTIRDIRPYEIDEPFGTIKASEYGRPSSVPRAFILDCQKAGSLDGERGVTLPQGDAPMFTVTSGKDGRQPVRAWLVDGQRTTGGSPTSRDGDAPSFPILAGYNHPVKAWLAGNNANDSSGARIYQEASEPAQTARTPTGGRELRAWLSQGRVVQMTPRALARFQSIPDSYILPDSSKLACTVIGNGVPPLLYQKIVGSLV